MGSVAVVIACPPEGSGPDGAVLLAPLAGTPVIGHSLAALAAAAGVDEIIVAAQTALAPRVSRLLAGGGYAKVSGVIEGGSGRAGCARAAVEALGAAPRDVLLHDAARALVARQAIEDCAGALADCGACCAVVPASDTMVAVQGGVVTERPPRDRVRRRQTPQGFGLGVLRRAYELAAADPAAGPADECGLVLRYLPGVAVRLVAGSEQAFAITGPAELAAAEAILRAPGLSAAPPA